MGTSGPTNVTANDTKGAHEKPLQVLPPDEHQRWDDFVNSCADGTLFHCTWWYRAWGMEPIVHVLADHQGQIQAGICYATGRWLLTKGIVRPPCTPRNGPLFRPSAKQGRHAQNTHVKSAMLAALGCLPRLGAYDFMLRPCDHDVLPFLWNGFETAVRYTYVVPCAEQATWQQHASKTQQQQLRSAARRAAEEGYAVVEAPSLDEVLPLLQQTADYKGYGLARIAARMPVWWQAVLARGAGRAYLLRDGQGRACSAALMVHDRCSAYYLAGGMRRDLRKGSFINTLLIQRMLRDAHAAGLDFDFEGSVLPGVEGFMRSFGGELRPLYRALKFPSPVAFLIWQARQYWSNHRRRWWLSYD